VGLELDSLGSGSDAETSRSDDVPVLFLIGSWRLSDLVPRKILLITTELAINTTASPVNSSLSIIHRRYVNYGVCSHILSNIKITADTHIIRYSRKYIIIIAGHLVRFYNLVLLLR
jgi:hypothetical protein